MAKAEGEKLPVGVGRVPQWWMELTPHYTLDLEEQEARQKAEEEMAVYLANMNAASDAGMLGPDGRPLPGWEKSNSSGGGGSGRWSGPGGRNFSAGGPGQFDPKWFGIDESHPDYQAYLTGAKLPPGYKEMMAKYRKNEDGADYNNLHQTNYGQYGRQAEKPQFQPPWAKMKLRSTKQGSAIRKGQYDDSPNRAVQRRIQETISQEEAQAMNAPQLDNGSETKTTGQVAPEPEPEQHTLQSLPKEPEAPAPKSQYKKYDFNDYYYNATPTPAPEQAPPQQERTPPTQNKKFNLNNVVGSAAPAPAPSQAMPQEEENYEEEYEVEEYTEEYTEEEYEEEVYEGESAEPEPELTDLQALLAAKQAELARLQAQL